MEGAFKEEEDVAVLGPRQHRDASSRVRDEGVAERGEEINCLLEDMMESSSRKLKNTQIPSGKTTLHISTS